MVLQRRNKDILIKVPDFVCVWGIRRWGVGRTGRCRWCSQCGRGTTRTGTRTQTKTTSRLSPWRRNHLSLSTMWTSWPAPAWETRCPAASMSKSKQTHNSRRTTNTHTLLLHHLLPTLVSTLSKGMVNLSLIKKVLCLILGRHLVLSAGCTFFFSVERQRIESHLSNQSPFVEDNALIVNQVPFACPLLFYKDVHWAHSLLLYIIMTHHLCVLKHFNPNVCGC